MYEETRERVKPITTYLRFKYDSGLLDRLSGACNSIGVQYDFTVAWGVYCKLVHPEFVRICKEYKLGLIPLLTEGASGMRRWEIPVAADALIPLDELVKISVFISDRKKEAVAEAYGFPDKCGLSITPLGHTFSKNTIPGYLTIITQCQ